MHRNSSDLFLAMLIAALSLLLGLPEFNVGWIRVILAVPILFVIPGYTMLSALFPKATFMFAEQALLSIGGSIALVILSGFALYWTPWGLQAISWVIILSGITHIASIVAMLRRHEQAAFLAHPKGAAINRRQVLSMVAACIIFITAIVIARTPVPASNVSGYSQLWMLPIDHTQQSVKLGLRSEEFTDVQYRLDIKIGDAIVCTWPSIELKPGQQWDAIADLPVGQPAGKDIEAQLYRLDAPGIVYRRAVLRGSS